MQAADPSPRGRVPRPTLHELARPSLLSHFDDPDLQLIVLTAPAGYGKTTLLAQHARRLEGRAVWLSLSEDDADPLLLSKRLAAAVQNLMPSLPLPEWTRLSAAGAAPEGLALALARDLTGSTTNLEFLLDGSEVLRGSAERWLAQWLGALAEGHRLLLAGRTEPALNLAGRVAAGSARLIGTQHLAFSAAETLSCLHNTPNAARASAIQAELGGWPVGVALVRSGAAPHLTPADLIREVLETLPPDLQQHLPDASVLDLWSDESAARIGAALEPGWLRQVRLAGLPLLPLDGSYQPHQLLREVLDAQLRRTPERHRTLHLAAGEGAEDAGDRLRAMRHYLAAGELDRALALAAELTRTYEQRGEFHLVRQVLEQLPEHRLPPELELCLGNAWLETGEATRGELLLHTLRERGFDSADLRFSLGMIAVRSAQWALGLEHVAEGLKLAATRHEQGRLLRVQAHAQMMLGQHEAAAATVDLALDLAQLDQNPLELAEATIQQLYNAQALGRSEEAETIIQRALGLYAQLGMPSRMLTLQNELASLLVLRHQPEQALELIAAALAFAEVDQKLDLAFLLETQGDALLECGDLAGAVTPYRRAFGLCSGFKTDVLAARIAPLLTEVALSTDQPEAAQPILAWVRQAASNDIYVPALHFCEGLWAAWRLDWPGAHAAFAAATPSGTFSIILPPERIALHLAHAACQLGSFTAGGAEALETDWASLDPSVFRATDRARLQAVQAYCERSGWPTSTLNRLVTELSPTIEPTVPLTLTIQSLGGVRVSLNGQALHLPLSKSAEVLVWLSLHGQASRDRLVDALWDGSNERRHIEYFKVAVRHLRATLAGHPAVTFNPLPFEGGVYRLSERLTIDLDVTRLKQATKHDLADLQRVLDEYIGPFLPLVQAPWAEAERTEALENVLAAALALGEQLEASQPEAAAAAYERAISLEPLSEEAHVRLLRLHLTQRQQGAAGQTYRRYRRMLADEWGRMPEREFSDLFEHI
jgi:LuxR family transcriptional regulator, maltose regulon positive regulatory protein